MKRKRICAWFITVAMLMTMLPSAFAVSFADTRGHWAEDSINRWSDRSVIRGHNGDFEPNSPITRADMAVIIDRVMDYQTKAENKFSDLDNAYYKDPPARGAGGRDAGRRKKCPSKGQDHPRRGCQHAGACAVGNGRRQLDELCGQQPHFLVGDGERSRFCKERLHRRPQRQPL